MSYRGVEVQCVEAASNEKNIVHKRLHHKHDNDASFSAPWTDWYTRNSEGLTRREPRGVGALSARLRRRLRGQGVQVPVRGFLHHPRKQCRARLVPVGKTRWSWWWRTRGPGGLRRTRADPSFDRTRLHGALRCCKEKKNWLNPVSRWMKVYFWIIVD